MSRTRSSFLLYKYSSLQYIETNSREFLEPMNKQKILDMINNEQVQTMIREGKTSSLIFSIKNHIGDLARVLEIFQVKFSNTSRKTCLFPFIETI